MATRAIIIPGVAPHKAMQIADNLRELDRLECEYMGRNSRDAVFDSIMMSDMDLLWTIEREGEPIGCFGCGLGIPWLLGTDGMLRIKKQFLRECLPYLKRMKDRYGILHNWVWEKNAPSRIWLRWCGFKEVECRALGSGVVFIKFELR